MSDVQELVRSAAQPLRPLTPDVVAINRRAVRNRRLQRASAWVLSVALLAGAAGIVGEVPWPGLPAIEPMGDAPDGADDGWVRVPFGELDPRGVEVGIVGAADVQTVARISRDRLPDVVDTLPEPIVRLAVADDGTAAVVSGHRVHLLRPDGTSDEIEVTACRGAERFDVVALDADGRLQLAATDHLADLDAVPTCLAVVPTDGSGGVAQARFVLPQRVDDSLVTSDGGWWGRTGHLETEQWTLLAENGRPATPPADPTEIAAAPDGLAVHHVFVDGDPNAIRQRTGSRFDVLDGDAVVGSVELASNHLWFQRRGSSLMVVPAGEGRRLALLEYEGEEGEGLLVVLGDAGHVAVARTGPAAADLHRAARGFTDWTVGGDGRIYWLEPDGNDMRLVRYRHPLP